MMGKKETAKELIEIADVYIDSAIDEFNMDTFLKGRMLVELAKGYLVQQKTRKRRRPRA